MLHEWTNRSSHLKKRVSSSPQSSGAAPTEPIQGHYAASKLWGLTTHWCSVTSQRNGNLSFYCTRMPLYHLFWIRFCTNLPILLSLSSHWYWHTVILAVLHLTIRPVTLLLGRSTVVWAPLWWWHLLSLRSWRCAPTLITTRTRRSAISCFQNMKCK